MTRISRVIYEGVVDDSGATAIEYALIASILGIALLPVLSNTSSGMGSLFVRLQNYFDRF